MTMKNFRPDNVSGHDAYLSSVNVESNFFHTKPVYLDKIFFSEGYGFPRGRGISSGLLPFSRYHDYSFEFLRLKTQINYLYITHGFFYHAFYHYSIYSQFRLAYNFFHLPEFSALENSDSTSIDLTFTTRDLLFYQIFFFPKSHSFLPFSVTSGDETKFVNSFFSDYDLVDFADHLSEQYWENPSYAFFSGPQFSLLSSDSTVNPILTNSDYSRFVSSLDPLNEDNFEQNITPSDDPLSLGDVTYNAMSAKAETTFSLPNSAQFTTNSSYIMNYTFPMGFSERSHYLRFFFFPQLAKASFSKDPLLIFRLLRIQDPRVNRKVRPTTRNLTFSPRKLYSNFPGSLLTSSDLKLDTFLAMYLKYNRPKRRRVKKFSSKKRQKLLDTFDDVFDSDLSISWNSLDFTSSDSYYFWPYTLGDFSILYAQIPFFQNYSLSLSRNFEFSFNYFVRPPMSSKIFRLPKDITFTNSFYSSRPGYSSLLHLPSFWRTATYPFQETDLSEYYYFYNNKFASIWIPFKFETYSHFVLNYYPIFLSSDAFLLRNAKRRYRHLTFSPKPDLPDKLETEKLDFGLPIVSKKYTFGDSRRGSRDLASFELLSYLRGIKYFYFFYIDAFMRSVTSAFSCFIPKIFLFFSSSANFEHFTKFSLFTLLYDRASFHNFILFVVKLDQFFYLTNGWYPYVHGRLSRRKETEDYDDSFRRVLRFESTFEFICFYFGFFGFYLFFFFEVFSSLLYYSLFRDWLNFFSQPEVINGFTFFLDFIFFTPWFQFHYGFELFAIDPIFAWVFSYSALF